MEFVILDFGDAGRVANKMTRSAALATDTFPVLAKIALDMYEVEGQVFESQGRRGGGSWAQLKPDTVKRKGSEEVLMGTAQFGYGMGPGDYLFRSVAVPGGEFNVLEFGGNTELIFGTDVPWAFVHQFGSKKRNIPRRPFIRFLPTDVTRWSTWFTEYIIEPFRAKAGITK